MTDQVAPAGHRWPAARPLTVLEVIRRLPAGSVVVTELEARQIQDRR